MADVTYKKNVDSYSETEHNYAAPDEILVTITLAEYRELVIFRAENEPKMRILRMEKHNLEEEVKKLKENISICKYGTEREDD